jgi:hypothetical protein
LFLRLADGPDLLEGESGECVEREVSAAGERGEQREWLIVGVVGEQIAEGGQDMCVGHF